MFCCTLLYVPFSFAIILMGKRELVASLSLSSWCLVIVVWLFLAVQCVCLQFVIVVFPDHTHYFSIYRYISTTEGDTRWHSLNQVLGSKLLLFVSSYLKMLVVLVVSEIRKSIACIIVLRTKQCSNWFLYEPF